MMTWVLFVALIFFVLFFYKKHDLRESLIYGSLVFSAVLLAITELLSAVEWITFPGIFASWVLLDLILFVYLFQNVGFKNSYRKLKKSLSSIERNSFLWMLASALLVTFAIALIAAPNNYDSMTYHMTRVAYWMQHHTLTHFPTHNTRQIFMSPWVEYVILHLQVLSFGADRLANLVQWGAYAGAIIASSLIAAHFAVSRIAQWLAALLVATTPMAILQASSTQTDLACSYWVLVFAWATLKLVDSDTGKSYLFWWVGSLALALAISSKGTAYVFCAPFVLGLFLLKLTRRNIEEAVKGGLMLAMIVLALNAPHYGRNLATFDDFFGDPDSLQKVKNQAHSLDALGSNLLRNLSLHLQTPIEEINNVTEGVVRKIHDLWNVDESDPDTTWGARFHLLKYSLHEDVAGNFLMLLLILASIGILLFKKQTTDLKFYLVCTLAGFLMFSFMLKWQPWGSRLQLPFFMLWAPLCPVVFTGLRPLPQRLVFLLASLCFLSSMPWLFYNSSRPVLLNQYNVSKNIFRTPRISQYFNNQRELEVPYYYAMQKLGSIDCREVGLITHLDSYEYPLFVIQREIDPGKQVFFYHMFVENSSAAILAPDPQVCAIMAIDQDDAWRPPVPYESWENVYRRPRVQIFTP